MNVTKDRFKDRQLHIEDYLQVEKTWRLSGSLRYGLPRISELVVWRTHGAPYFSGGK